MVERDSAVPGILLIGALPTAFRLEESVRIKWATAPNGTGMWAVSDYRLGREVLADTRLSSVGLQPFTEKTAAECLKRLSGGLVVNAACAGFCHALGVTSGLLRARTSRRALVDGVEKMTDGEGDGGRRRGRTYGAPPRGVGRRRRPGRPRHRSRPAQQRRHAGAGRPPLGADQLVARHAGVSSDLKGFVTHQANLRLIEHLAAALVAPARPSAGTSPSAATPPPRPCRRRFPGSSAPAGSGPGARFRRWA